MPTTSNFGWTTPADTDLVKDGAAAIRTLGNGIDTSFLDLKGGTTDQVLAKNSNTDLDFKWVAQDDSNAIQNAIVDAKGDLITATAADTPARLAVGTNGQYLQADSTTATGLKWASVSAGAMTELASGSLSTSALDLTSISGTYNDLILRLRDFYPSSNATLTMTVNNTANIYREVFDYATNAVTDSNIEVLNGGTMSTANDANFMTIRFNDYAQTTASKTCDISFVTTNSVSGFNIGVLAGIMRISSAIDRITLTLSAGTFSGGTYVLYGVK